MLILNKSDLLSSTSLEENIDKDNKIVIDRIKRLVNVYHDNMNKNNVDKYDDIKAPMMLAVSCLTGDGISNLESALSESVVNLLEHVGVSSDVNAESALITRDRHRRHVTECVNHLDVFLHGRVPTDAAAEELRLAMLELGKITGMVDVDEILDIIFRDFCIGK